MLKGIKSWFFVEVEEDPKKKGNPSQDAPKTVKKIKEIDPAPPSKESLPESKDGRSGEVSQKFVDILFKALRQNNMEGFDYNALLDFRFWGVSL